MERTIYALWEHIASMFLAVFLLKKLFLFLRLLRLLCYVMTDDASKTC